MSVTNACLPAYSQRRPHLDLEEHDDPEWMVNAATAELQCLHAQDLSQQGRGFVAINIMDKVSLPNAMFACAVAAVQASTCIAEGCHGVILTWCCFS